DALRQIGEPEAIKVLTNNLFSTDRRLALLAGQALAASPYAEATAALKLRDAAARNDWRALEQVGPDGEHALSALLESALYLTWPSGKRNEILTLAIKLGATPPVRYGQKFASVEIFVSGVHTVGDLIKGLEHRTPTIRIAAAMKLGEAGHAWTARPLYQHFLRE